MIIDCHCHEGLGDGLTGPWDTAAPLDAYLRANIVALRLAHAIAAEFAISERTLHRIFADRGTTFERHVLHLRIEHADELPLRAAHAIQRAAVKIAGAAP